MTHFQFTFIISTQAANIPYGIFLKSVWKWEQQTDKYLVKDMLVFGKSWSIEQMFDDTEIQYLVSNRYPEPVPRLQSSERSGGREEEFVLVPTKPPKRTWGKTVTTESLIHQGQRSDITANDHWKLIDESGCWKALTWKQNIIADSLQTGGKNPSPHPHSLGEGKDNQQRFLSLLPFSQKYLPTPH